MSEIKITFESLYEVLRRERSREEVQEVSDGFLKDVQEYCEEKQRYYDESIRKNDLFSISENEKLHLQISNIRRVLKELYDRRERKAILLALNKARTGVRPADATFLLPHEKVLFDEMTRIIVDARERNLYPLLNSALSTTTQEIPRADNGTKVKFTKPTEAFVGKNLEVLGPYSIGDEAELSKEIVELLIEKGNAVKA